MSKNINQYTFSAEHAQSSSGPTPEGSTKFSIDPNESPNSKIVFALGKRNISSYTNGSGCR